MPDPSNVASPLLEVAELEDFLIFLKQVQQVDLTGYKRPTLLRRLRIRMQQVKVNHYQEYLDYLKQKPDEVTHLLNAVFINYTFFFRDRPVWDYLANEVIPQIIRNKAPNEPIRIWSAGCASGEETYSIAILLIEALGIEQFQQRVRIYGTDVDSDALQQAQRGCYSHRAIATVPPDFLDRYFEYTPNGYRWRHELCGSITFHHHNLIQSPPLRNIDLLICRNTLMYLMSETQIRALTRFHFSLQPHGFLVLGQAEDLVTYLQRSFFAVMDSKARIFTKERVDRRSLPPSFWQVPMLNKGLRNGTVLKYPSPSPEDVEQQSVQLEMIENEIEWLHEQVRSLQDELCDRIQQQHEVEQELKATKQELALMNQEIHRRMRTE
jgi:chemotaxis methyl-accepting protein methylase